MIVAVASLLWSDSALSAMEMQSTNKPLLMPALHPLPDDDHPLIGREENITSLLHWLNFSTNVKVVGVFGSPGIGKSHLVRTSARIIQQQGSVTVEYYDLKDIVSVRDLQQSITNRSLLPVKSWAQLMTKETLLLLDNCDELIDTDQSDLQQLIEDLVRYSNHRIKVVYTSQRMITTTAVTVKTLTLFELNMADAVKLLRSWCPQLDSYEAKEVADLCNKIPLALQIAGATIAVEGCHTSEFIAELKEEYQGDALSQDILPEQQRMSSVLEFSFKRLDDYPKACGPLLAHFPGSFNREAAIHVIKSLKQFLIDHQEQVNVTDMPSFSSAKPSSCLQQLRHRSWLNYHTNTERYSFHSLLYGFLLQLPDRERVLPAKLTESLFNSSFAAHFRQHWVTFLHVELQTLLGYKDSSTPNSDMSNSAGQLDRLLATEKHNLHHAGKIFLDNGEITRKLVTDSNAFKKVTESLTQDRTWLLMLYLFNRPQSESTRLEVAKLLPLYRTTVSSFELHQYQFVNEIGIRNYLDSYIEAIVQVSALEEFVHGSDKSVDFILSKRTTIEELHEKFGHTVNLTKSLTCYYNSVMMFAVIGFRINATMHLILTKISSSPSLPNPCQSKQSRCSNYLMAFSHIAEGDYLKAAEALESSLPSKETLKLNAQHFHTLVLIYYCYLFSDSDLKAAESLRLHSQPSLEILGEETMTGLTSTYMTILFQFYNEVGVEPPLSPLPAIAERIEVFNQTGTITPVTFLSKR